MSSDRKRPQLIQFFQATGLVKPSDLSSIYCATKMPVRLKQQLEQRCRSSGHQPAPLHTLRSAAGSTAQVVLPMPFQNCSRQPSASILHSPKQTLLTLESLFQFAEDCIPRLLRVLVEALTVPGLVMAFQVVLFQHRHDFFAY